MGLLNYAQPLLSKDRTPLLIAKPVFDDVSLEVSKWALFGLPGPNGSAHRQNRIKDILLLYEYNAGLWETTLICLSNKLRNSI
jgi:hypothetical protein